MRRRSTLTNTLSEPYDQVINGKRIYLKPGETQEFDRYEAVDIKGFYPGYEVKCGLKINHLPDEDDVKIASGKVYCAPDGKEFKTQQECMVYIESVNKSKKTG